MVSSIGAGVTQKIIAGQQEPLNRDGDDVGEGRRRLAAKTGLVLDQLGRCTRLGHPSYSSGICLQFNHLTQDVTTHTLDAHVPLEQEDQEDQGSGCQDGSIRGRADEIFGGFL